MAKNSDIDVVRRHIEMAGNYAGNVVSSEVKSIGRRWADYSQCESPLEAIFMVWSFAYFRMMWTDCEVKQQVDVTAGGQEYRLDFVVVPSHLLAVCAKHFGVSWPKVAVEVDGHEFHEKTRTQVAYRNARDRALQSDGWTVFHFSWSELTDAPTECVQEVFDAVSRGWIDARREVEDRLTSNTDS